MEESELDHLKSEVQHWKGEAVKAAAAAERLQKDLLVKDALLGRLHAVAKHGSVRSGALTYLRDELLKAFGDKQPPA